MSLAILFLVVFGGTIATRLAIYLIGKRRRVR